MMLIADKNNNVSVEDLTYIITRMTTRPTGLAAMLAIMSVSTFKTVVILYLVRHEICITCAWDSRSTYINIIYKE